MANDLLKYSQNMFTYCVEKYGTLQEINRLVLDNNLIYNEQLDQGKDLIFNNDFGNEDIKDYFKIKSLIPSNQIDNPFTVNNYIFEDGNNFIFEDDSNFIFEF